MNAEEWCAVVHVDIGTVDGLGAVKEALRAFAEAADAGPRTITRSVLGLIGRPNHFEIVGRFASEAAYLSHLETASNLAMREMIADVLGLPYEDRVHGPRGPQSWPIAREGDFVAITQIEARPRHLATAERLFDELASARLATGDVSGQVSVQRRQLPFGLELISVWSSPEAFEEHLADVRQQEVRAALEGELLAPIDDRRYTLTAGAWLTS